MKVAPNVITWMSIAPVFIGLALFCFGDSKTTLMWGWFCFFLWSELDGIDGTVARYTKQYTKMGDTLDAMAGYFAMAFIYLAGGVGAAHFPGIFTGYNIASSELLIITGALSGMWTILPRLVLHKAINSTGDKEIGKLGDRGNYSTLKLFALNICSIRSSFRCFSKYNTKD